jgi:TrkA-N domain/RyR domain
VEIGCHTNLVRDPTIAVGGVTRRRGARAALRRWWEDYRWPAIAVLVAAVLALGFFGYRSLLEARGEDYSVADLLYLDLQLFFVNVSDRGDDLPPALIVARFAAPAIAFYSALLALTRLFRDRVDELRFRFRSGHAVVAGAGDTGLVFTRALCQLGVKVAVVDVDAANPNLEACRELGAGVLVADAREPETLLRAGVAKAGQLIATTGSDTANAEVVLEASRIAEARRVPLHCLAHIVDADLWRLLRTYEFQRPTDGLVRFDFFNLYAAAARRLLSDHPPFPSDADGRTGVLVVGGGELAQRVALETGRRWSALRREEQLCITVLAERAGDLVDQLLRESPQLGERCDLTGVDGPLDVLAVHTAAAGLAPVGAAYVCMEDDPTAIAIAGVIQQRFRQAAVVLCILRDTGFVRLLNDTQVGGEGALGAVHAFSILERTCHPELRLVAIDENLARSIHEHHREIRLLGGAGPDEPALQDWDDLSEDLRSSNRQQARHISTKLRAIACELVPYPGWEPPRMAFDPGEVELLAEMEHQRWVDERTAAGWHLGDPADVERKVSPYLLGWGELPEQVREWNREAVREIPDLVALEGFEVVRLADDSAASRATAPWIDDVARAIHRQYLARRGDEAPAADGPTPSRLAWEELPAALQESNRDQAAAIPAHLAVVGCRIDRSAGNDGFDGFTAREVEVLARREHERWVRERRGSGVGLATDLVPWEQLAEDRRELDREAVRAIPVVLAAAGLSVERDVAGS